VLWLSGNASSLRSRDSLALLGGLDIYGLIVPGLKAKQIVSTCITFCKCTVSLGAKYKHT